jgi:hypothetical protein
MEIQDTFNAGRNHLCHQAAFPLPWRRGGKWYEEVCKQLWHLRMEKSQSSSLPFTCWQAGGYKKMSSILVDQMAPSYMSPNSCGGGGGGCGVSQPSTAVHRSPNKLGRSNSILNLCWEESPASSSQLSSFRGVGGKERTG